MAYLLKIIGVAAFGGLLGLVATFYSIKDGALFGGVRAGPWTSWPKSGARDADPYARAAFARSGETPLGAAEGLSFIARRDGAGRPLDPHCDYVVAGAVPAARYWTVTALGRDGRPLPADGRVRHFTSAEIVRDADGGFAINLSTRARPGNWLGLREDVPFALLLRLYDATVSAAASAFDGRALPAITRARCA